MRPFRIVVVTTCAALGSLGLLPELACAPDSFDGIVGGVRDSGAEGEASIELRSDENLPAPRPIAPLSVSWVNATRVRFRWELALGTTGARIELCRTRECDGERKTFDVEGDELLTPEDLATGFWFWRLYGKTADAVGTTPSVTWELLVRGGRLTSGNGTGSIVDVNGDGAPDLVVMLAVPGDAGAGPPFLLSPLLGAKDDPTRFTEPFAGAYLGVTSRTALASSDLDGDGFSDVAATFEFGSLSELFVALGAPDGDLREPGPVITPPLREPPDLREAGDIDLDGRGDVVVSTNRDIFFVRGAPTGLGATMYGFQLGAFDRDGGVPVLPSPIAIGAGHDGDGDGYPEVAFAWPFPGSPVAFLLPGFPGGAVFENAKLGPPPKLGATAFADGDFDGAGLNDTAFATTIDGAPAVCILKTFGWIRKRPTVCWAPPSPAPSGFASSMTAGDLDEDGRDELIVGSTANGIWILRLAGESITAEHLDVPYGVRVTTIHPGRPGPAVWAATQPSGADIAIFVGTTKSASIPPPPPASRFGPAIR